MSNVAARSALAAPPPDYDRVFANYLGKLDKALVELQAQRSALFGVTVGHIRAADAELMRCRAARLMDVVELGAQS